MNRYNDNLSLLAIGFGFASVCISVFGSVILSAEGSTLGNTLFAFGFILFIIFIIAGIIIRRVRDQKESVENKEVKEVREGLKE
jgi:hypothetical protein